MIEAFHYIDEQGFIAWRARGRTARSMPDLAALLGVDLSELQPRPDPDQREQAQKRRHRERQGRIARGVYFDPHTGR